MAGYFDSLFGLDTNPEDRDYKKLSEITSPEEFEAYRAGSSATGIPGLDYARSLFRGAKKELTDPSMGPLGERFNEVMGEYERRKAAAADLERRFPGAFRAGRLRGTEAIPGAEAAFMAQPGVAAAASPFVRGAMRSAPAAMEREIGALPAGFDIMEQQPTTGSWEALDRLRRTDRMTQPRQSIWPELRLNPHGPDFTPEAAETSVVISPKTPSAADISAQLDQPTARSWSDIQPADMNKNVRSALLRSQQTGLPLNAREQKMVDTYFRSFKNRPNLDMRSDAKLNLASPTMGIHGEAAADIDANIAARNAAEAARDARFANLPPVLQTNAFMKRANRLIEGAEEAQNFGLGKGLNSNFYRAPDAVALGMEEGAAYKPPPSPNSVPLLAQRPDMMSKALKLTGPAGAAGTGFGVGVLTGKSPQGVEQGPPLPASHVAVGAPMPREARGPMASEMRTVPTVSTDERTRPARRAPVPVSRPARPVQRRAAPSGEMYYGDYRDLEPFASDPIGNFIDELTGQRVKRSKTKGTARQGGLGDLLPFEHGGAVRHGYATDGAVEDEEIPILSDIGDALGGLFGEGKEPVVARDEEPRGRPSKSFFEEWSTNPMSQLLFSSGLAAMAAPTRNPFVAMGMGGLKGLEYMRAAQSAQAAMREKEEERADLMRQRKILERLSGPVAEDEEETAVPGSLPKTTMPAVPSAKPLAVPSTAGTEETPKPETATLTGPSPKAEPAAERREAPVVATDSSLDKLYKYHRRLSDAMGLITNPQLRSALASKQRSIEFEIQRIETTKAKELEELRRFEDQKRLEKREEREAYERSPEGIRAKTRVEQAVKDEDKIIDSTNELASTADSALKDIEAVENAYKKGEIHTSPMTQSVLKTLQGYGYELSPEITDALINSKSIENTETLQAIGVADLMKKIGGSLGTAVSDADRKTIERMAAGLDKSPATNLRMLATLKRIMQRAQDARQFMIDYQTEKGSLDENYQAALAKHFADKPLVMTDRQRRAAQILREREKAGQ